MAPTTESLYDESSKARVELLPSLGIPIENSKIHPDCQRDVSADMTTWRRAEWGFKILRAFMGMYEFELNTLRQKVKRIQNLIDVMLRYPNMQARC